MDQAGRQHSVRRQPRGHGDADIGDKKRSDPTRQGFPALTGTLVIDSVRGRLRVRKWPRKRGKPKSAVTRQQNETFRERARIMKFAAASQVKIAMTTAKGTGLYPRDLLMRAMATGLFDIKPEDGPLITYRRDEIVPTTFQGFILALAANQVIGAGAFAAPTWPLPVLDTGQFWNAGTPTLITVPTGVTVMRFDAGLASATASGGRVIGRFRRNGLAIEPFTNLNCTGTQGLTLSTGPKAVVAGETWDVQFFLAAGGTLVGNAGSFFGGEVLAAA